VLVTFIRKQMHDNCLIWNCTPDSRLHTMGSMLIYLTLISWTPLCADLRVDRMPNTSKLIHWEVTLLYLTISSCTNLDRIFQKLIETPLSLFCSYIRHFCRRIMNTASAITIYFRFHNFYTVLYTTLHCDNPLNVPANVTNNMSSLHAMHPIIPTHSIILHTPHLLNC
jgi:hypothetical protein